MNIFPKRYWKEQYREIVQRILKNEDFVSEQTNDQPVSS